MATGTNNKPADTTLAKQQPRVTTKVLEQINGLRAKGLQIPPHYSPANALNAAWLILQEVQNMDKKPIFNNGQLTGIVTELSVVNALHDMVIQGLNPSKKQCYFIVYGNKVVCQRSYFGDMVVAERAKPGITFYFDTINEGDEFEMEKARTRNGFVTTIAKHKQPFPRSDALLGAYCGAFDKDGNDLGAEVFDMDRIKKSWAKSKMPKTQNEFPSEMALRTIIRRYCKPIINASNDQFLLQSIARQDVETIDAEIVEEAEMNANVEALALDPVPEHTDAETGEVYDDSKGDAGF